MRKFYLAIIFSIATLNLYAQSITISLETNTVVGTTVLTPGATSQNIFGIKLAKSGGGAGSVSGITVNLSSDPTGKFTNPQIWRSSDNALDGTDAAFAGSFSGNTIVFTGSPLTNFGGGAGATNRWFFLTVDIAAGATGTETLSFSDAELTADITVNSNSISHPVSPYTFLTTTIASLNAGANNVALSPLIANNTGQGVFGFSLTSGGSQTVTVINVQLSSDPSGKLGTYSLVRSTDADFSTTGDNTTIGGLVFTPTATQVGITGLSEVITSTTKNYFLVANVNAAVTGATAGITASLGTANITVGAGDKVGTAAGTAYSFAAITATIGSLNAGANNIAGSPLIAGTTGKGVFGFSLTSNSSQTVSVINVQLTSDPAGKLGTYSLVRSTDADFSTTGDNTTIGGLVFTPTTSQIGITGLSEAISTGSTKNYFLVADVDPSVTGATAAITPSLGTSDVTVNTGIVAGSSSGKNYSFQALATTITGSGGTINLVGGATNQSIFTFSAQSNDTQTLSQLDFVFSVDISSIFNTSNFVFKNGVTTVGTPSYNSGTNTLTITGINVGLSTSQNFTLVGDLLASAATSSQTLSLQTSGVAVSSGVVNSFTTITNTLSVTALSTTVTATNATIPLVAGATNQTIYTLSALSNGSQTLDQLDFIFSVDISAVFNTSNFVFKNGVTTVGTPSYNSGTKTLTITGINVSLATSQSFTLTGDLLSSAATSSQTLALSTSGVTVTGGGSVNAFATKTKTLNVTALSTTVTASTSTIPLVGGATNQSIFTLSAASNGSQSLDQLDFVFSVDISTIFNTSNFVFRNGVTVVGTPSYNSGTNTLSVTGIGVSISSLQNFTLSADVLASAPASSQTVSLSTSGVGVTGGGTVNSFTTATKTLNVTGLAATLTEITGGTAPVNLGTVLSAGAANVVLSGFSVSSTGTQQITAVNFNLSGLGSQFSNIRLFRSASAGTAGASIATNASGNFTGLTENVSSTAYFYLVANVAQSVTSNTGTTPSVTVAPTEANVTFSSGSKNTMSISRTFTFNSSQLSSITLNGGTSTNIAYGSFLDTGDNDINGLLESKNIATFRIIDPANDPDNLGTTLTDLTLSISNSANIDRIVLFDDTNTEIVGTDVPCASTVIYSGLNILANDNGASNGTKDFTVRVSFKSAVTDNDIIQVTITSATASNLGSGFAAANAGGATSGGGANNIVVTATKLIFADPLNLPPAGGEYRGPLSATPAPNPGSTFSATVWAVDANDNRDLNQTSSITLNVTSGPGSLTGGGSQALVAGARTFSSLTVDLAGNYNLNASDGGGLTDATSGNNTSLALDITSLGVTLSKANLSSCQVGSKNIFTSLTSLVLTESDPSDFTPGTNLTFLMILPSGWEYLIPSTSSPTPAYTAPSITFTPAKNITTATFSGFIGNNIAKFIYSASNTSQYDVLTISGLYVKNVGSSRVDLQACKLEYSIVSPK